MNPSIQVSDALVAIERRVRQLNDLIAQDKIQSAIYIAESITCWAQDLRAELTRMKESK